MNLVSLAILTVISFVGMHRLCYAIDPAFELKPSQIPGLQSIKTANAAPKEKTVRKKYRKRNVQRQVLSASSSTDDRTQSFHLSSAQMQTPDSGFDQRKLSAFWERLVPSATEEYRPFESNSDIFNLALDPERYPQIKSKNGKRLVIDRNNTLPPLVKSLIQEQDRNVVVITGTPGNDRHFIRTLLAAGDFFSVEEQAVISFGNDPRLKVTSDFKVERTVESLLKNEVILVSSSAQKYPEALNQYLNNHGVTLLEPLAGTSPQPLPPRHRLIIVPPGKYAPKTVSNILENLVEDVIPNKRIELFQAADSGIKLSVTAGYYFEFKGQRYVVSTFSGDPVVFTLFRLLETKGYRVILLNEKDDFKDIVSKVLRRMGLKHTYAQQKILSDPEGKYMLELSGFVVEEVLKGNGSLVFTDIKPEQGILTMLGQHGYLVQETVTNVK